MEFRCRKASSNTYYTHNNNNNKYTHYEIELYRFCKRSAHLIDVVIKQLYSCFIKIMYMKWLNEIRWYVVHIVIYRILA